MKINLTKNFIQREKVTAHGIIAKTTDVTVNGKTINYAKFLTQDEAGNDVWISFENTKLNLKADAEKVISLRGHLGGKKYINKVTNEPGYNNRFYNIEVL